MYMEINDFIKHQCPTHSHPGGPSSHFLSLPVSGKYTSTVSSWTNIYPPGNQIRRFQKGNEELEQCCLETKTNFLKVCCLVFLKLRTCAIQKCPFSSSNNTFMTYHICHLHLCYGFTTIVLPFCQGAWSRMELPYMPLNRCLPISV